MRDNSNRNRSRWASALPFLTWLRGYRFYDFRCDFLAGATVSVVLVPQAMAYAMLAGMPPIYGLYAAAVTPVLGSLWGSLRQLSTGPVAITSLLVLTTLSPLAQPGSPEFISLAFLLAFMIGTVYLLVGIFRIGFLMIFISHATIRGFTSAAAIIIVTTQLPLLLGISVSRHESIFPMIREILLKLPEASPLTFGMGLFAFGIIYGVKRFRSRFPAGIPALAATTILTALLGLEEYGLAIIGSIPEGLPKFIPPDLNPEIFILLAGPAVVIGLVGFTETYSLGKTIAAQTRQMVHVDQEFLGQGLANIAGSFFQSFPVGGSLSRTAVNLASGARTGISGVLSGLGVVIVLLFFTPALAYIPKATLAAVVISAVLLLFNPREVFSLWRMNRDDGIVGVAVFILVLVIKPDYALMIGVVLSQIFFLWKTMHPRIVRIAKDPRLDLFLNADQGEKPDCPQILLLRPDNPIYFGNAEYTIEHILDRTKERSPLPKHLLLDFESVGFIDITGIDELRILRDELENLNVNLAITNVRSPVLRVMKSSGFIEDLGEKNLFFGKGKAISGLFDSIDHDYCRKICPYSLFIECESMESDLKPGSTPLVRSTVKASA